MRSAIPVRLGLLLALAAARGPAADELVVAPELAPFVAWIRAERAPSAQERAGLAAGVTAALALPEGARFVLAAEPGDTRAGDTGLLRGAVVGPAVARSGWPGGRMACSVTLELGQVSLARVLLLDAAPRSAWVRERTGRRHLPRAVLPAALEALLGAARALARPGLETVELVARAGTDGGGAPTLELTADLHFAGAAADSGRLAVHGRERLPESATPDAPPGARPAPAYAGWSWTELGLGASLDRALGLVRELDAWPARVFVLQHGPHDDSLFAWLWVGDPDGPDGLLALDVRGFEVDRPERARVRWDEVEVALPAAGAALRAAVRFAARGGDALGFVAAFPPAGEAPGTLVAVATPAGVPPCSAGRARLAAIAFGGARVRELAVVGVHGREDRVDRRFLAHLEGGGFLDLDLRSRFCLLPGEPFLQGAGFRERVGPERRGRVLGGTGTR